MNKIKKFLNKLTREEREKAKDLMAQIISGDTGGLNIVKLKDHADMYRVRKGRVRIKFRRDKFGVEITGVGFRDEDTYKHL